MSTVHSTHITSTSHLPLYHIHHSMIWHHTWHWHHTHDTDIIHHSMILHHTWHWHHTHDTRHTRSSNLLLNHTFSHHLPQESATCLFAVILGVFPPKQENDTEWLKDHRGKEWVASLLPSLNTPNYVGTPVGSEVEGGGEGRGERREEQMKALEGILSELRETAAGLTVPAMETQVCVCDVCVWCVCVMCVEWVPGSPSVPRHQCWT